MPEKSKSPPRSEARKRLTAQQRMEAARQAGRKSVDYRTPAVIDAALASVARNMFGIPEHLAAASLRWLPSQITGNKSDATYDELLEAVRALNDERMKRSFLGSLGGGIVGAAASGGAAGRLIGAGASRLAGASSPAVSRAGNVLQNAITLKRGQTARNVLKSVGAGAAGGAAQAVGEGSDVAEGSLYGAAGGALAPAAVKAARFAAGTARRAVRPYSRSREKALKEVITESPEAVSARQRALSEQIQGNAPLIGALNQTDAANVRDNVLQYSSQATENAKSQVENYLGGFMNRMIQHVNNAANARMTQSSYGPLTATVGDLAQQRKDTADSLMKPIENETFDLREIPFDKIERQLAKEIGIRMRDLTSRAREAFNDIDLDNDFGIEIDKKDLQRAHQLLTDWGLGKPVLANVREIDSLRRALNAAGKATRSSNPANSMAYLNTAKVIGDFLSSKFPEYGEMLDTYARQSRMLEGFKTAASGKRISDIEDDQLRANLQTNEGRVGLQAGELFRLRKMVSSSPGRAINLAREFASLGRFTRPAMGDGSPVGSVTENIGDAAASSLARSAQGETQILNRMLDTEKLKSLAVEDSLDGLSPYDLAYGAFLQNSLATTKGMFLARMLRKLSPRGYRNDVANDITEMLYSSDPEMTQKGLAMLRRAGFGKKAISTMGREIENSLRRMGLDDNAIEQMKVRYPGIGAMIGAGSLTASAASMNTISPPDEPASQGVDQTQPLTEELDYSQLSDEELLRLLEETRNGDEQSQAEEPDYSQLSDEELLRLLEDTRNGTEQFEDDGVSSETYANQLQALYDNENPEFLDLVNRVMQQESGGTQFDRNGRPLRSPAGAVGVMQVMPETGPEAARLAGLPWDPEAFYNDPAYNQLLGIAYLGEMLRRYDGDVELALAAYNAGPGAVERYGGVPPFRETMEYIDSIMQ